MSWHTVPNTSQPNKYIGLHRYIACHFSFSARCTSLNVLFMAPAWPSSCGSRGTGSRCALCKIDLAQALKCAGIREALSCPEVIATALDDHTCSRICCPLLRSAPVVTNPVHAIHAVHHLQHVDTMRQGVQSSPRYGAKP